MLRLLPLAAILAAPHLTHAAQWPNKPGKKPAAQPVIGAQFGLAPEAGETPLVGAAGTVGTGSGDLGFTAETRPTAEHPRVGYEPARQLGNKGPRS